MNRSKRHLLAWAASLAMMPWAHAQSDTVKIGLILPMTGQQASTGRQIDAAVKLWQAQNGTKVGGKTVQVILKDDAAVPDTSRRLAQELVVNDKVTVLAGFGVTPAAMAMASIAIQSKTPMVVMAAGISAITEASPYIVRTSFTVAQSAAPMAVWATKNNVKKVVTIVTDYAPGIDAEKAFSEPFAKAGGKVDSVRVPLRNPDFAPFLQRAADEKPDALFVFVPSGAGTQLMKQYAERGLDKSGIRLIGPGDMTDDDILNDMGDVALGVITTQFYSAAHPSAENKAYVEAFKKANNGMRPNFMSVGGYDGMHLIYEALKKTKGSTDGDALVSAMKSMSWTSPRGPISIDPATRDIVQNIYVRKVEKVGGELYNVEFATIPNVKDPVKAAATK